VTLTPFLFPIRVQASILRHEGFYVASEKVDGNPGRCDVFRVEEALSFRPEVDFVEGESVDIDFRGSPCWHVRVR
jgi:hypothetical protein